MIHKTILLIQEALQLLQEVVLTYQDNKLVLALSAAVAGAILTKLIPSLWGWLVNLATWLGRLAGGRLAYRDFQRRYLDWVVTEYKELRLTGVVTSDDAKKPKLEQVFVSVRVGKEKNTETANPNERLLIAGRVPTWRDLIDMVTAAHRKCSKLDRDAQFMFYGVERELAKQRRIYLRGKWFRQLRARSAFEIEDEKKRRAWIARQGDTFKEELAESQLEQILRDQNRVAILGAPGAGKTTLLQYLALSYGRERASDPKLHERGILKRRLGTRAWRLPIFIRLSSVAKMLVEFDDKLRDASIVDILPRILPPDLQATDVTSDFFIHYLKGVNACSYLTVLMKYQLTKSLRPLLELSRVYVLLTK